MKKAMAIHEAILTVGMVVISATLLATQIPSMINDIQESLSEESVKEKANELANLLSLVTASPSEIELLYTFHSEKTYDVVIKNGYVTVKSGSNQATAKTLVYIEFDKENLQSLKIVKTSEGVMLE